ncbi:MULTISPECIES: hypothetical protein [Microbacterium]|uniref:hypothetical protein n=1 Tax=Microbacterium TaxID=33882 RepID=UPI0027D842EC|nr:MULTISPECIES: hypothetical protein [Microbacterium]
MNDGEGADTWLARRERVKAKGINGNGMGMPLPIAVQLLPTPSTSNAHGNEMNGRGEPLLPGIVNLLPTPSAALGDGGQKSRSGARKGEPLLGGIAELASARLLPTPEAKNAHAGPDRARAGRLASGGDDLVTSIHRHGDEPDWGEYAAAIARWERVIGRPAPRPTRPDGRDGAPRLNPEFVEWMMGWPAGHVTDPLIGLARAAQLKACGNGVVPLQAVIAILTMLARPGVPALITKEAA